MLPDTTYDNVVLQLTSKAINSSMASDQKVMVKMSDLISIFNDLKAVTYLPTATEVRSIKTDLENAIRKIETLAKPVVVYEKQFFPRLSLDETIMSLKEIKSQATTPGMDTEKGVGGALLSKRTELPTQSYGQRKAKRFNSKAAKDKPPCRSCGKLGHWWRDNSECLEKYREKLEQQLRHINDRNDHENKGRAKEKRVGINDTPKMIYDDEPPRAGSPDHYSVCFL